VRLARLADYKRRVRERAHEWPLQLRRFAIANVPSLGTTEVALNSPFLILSGPNGVGKTTVLRAMWAVSAPEVAEQTPGAALKLTAGAASLDYSWNGVSARSEVTFVGGKAVGGTALPINVMHLDASVEPLRFQKQFCEFDAVEDLLNGVGGVDVAEKELRLINYICKRNYTRVSVYEVEDGELTTPFFNVSAAAESYDSRSMGSGELIALYIWWKVNQVEPQSLLLIEEPETFLSPACQESLAHYLLKNTVEKKLVTIITSHSAKIVDSVADEHRLFLYKDGANAKFAPPPVSPTLLKTIGIEPTVDVICLVEDEAASVFLTMLLERFAPTLARKCEVSNQSGDGNIVSLLEKAGGQFKAVSVVGMFDGDLKGKAPAKVVAYAGFLPGDEPIEVIFKNLVSMDPAAAGELLVSPRLPEILFALQGADHHDWYAGLSAELGMSKSQIFPTLFHLWVQQPGHEALAEQALASLLAAIKGNGGAMPIEVDETALAV